MGSRTFIKICGLTRVGDVRAAVSCGASAVGFVFARSPRRVSISRAADLRRRVHPSVDIFGVFVDAGVDQVLRVIEEVGLTGVQLQGSENPDYVAELKRSSPSTAVYKVVRTTRREDLDEAGGFGADGLFLDPKDPARPLDRSATIPIGWLKDLAIEHLVVAGGLNPSNVGELVRAVHPWGVDVSAGVEAGPGKKDPRLIAGFVRAVREAEA